MEAKEKAKDLVDKFTDAIFRNKSIKDTGVLDEVQLRAKQCAIICCEETIEALMTMGVIGMKYEIIEYWQQVKTKIQNK